jgi:transcriptional regulator with XRE-family HTH domain
VRFGLYLRGERERQGFSQGRLARAAFIHRMHVSYIECGQREPRLETVVYLARALGMEPAELVARWWESERVE